MEKKIQYSFMGLSMMLFLAISVVSAKLENPNNLYSVVYVGDTNVTVGNPFWIQCLADGPIEWHKDDEPIQKMHFIRHSKEDYAYNQQDEPFPNSRMVKSTIKVNHALKMHGGKYKCNMKHKKSHLLYVNDAKSAIVELDSGFGSMEDEYDDRVSFEPQVVVEDALKSTMMMFVEEVSESTRIFSSNFEESFEQELQKVSDKMYDLDDIVVTTELPHQPKHDLNHKHNNNNNINKHKVHEPFVPHEIHNPHELPFDTHANHVVLPTATEHTTTTTSTTIKPILNVPKHHHKAKLTPLYDNDQHYKLFLITKPLVLACNANDTSKIIWMKDDKDVREIDELKGHFQIYPKEGRFVIEKSREQDAGNYSCNLDNESHKFEVWAEVVVRVPQNTYVVENDKLEITCVVRGTEPEIQWFFKNSSNPEDKIEIFENDKIKLEENDDIPSTKLIIDRVELSDHGTFICAGTNKVMRALERDLAESDGLVRVKGKLAALWPFLGICAEVFILCAIILIYEKRRNKTDLDESDTDQSPDQKNDHHIKDSDVRHRK